MKKALSLGLLSALVLALPASAEVSQVGQSKGEIGAGVGYTSFDANKSVDGTSDAGAGLGVRGGYNFTPLFELEGQLADNNASESGVDISMDTYMVNAVFNFHPNDAIEPYVLGGLGYANVSADSQFGSVSDGSNALQVAGGCRFFFGQKKQAGVRVELAALREDTFDQSSLHSNLNVGFTWRFGR
jgi:opacity protein-like surface antigen